MAITIDDFSKIWASTSPLTPYEFSESQYKDGWNFIGVTPPSRQMWDFMQKNNDEKMQYLANNYLPLSGGTMTGAIEGNPLTLTADDGNGNSSDMVLNADGSATLDGSNIITSALTGNILTESGTAPTTGGTTHELCSITTHEAGVWLIVSFVDLNASLPATAGSYQNIISTENHGERMCRGYGHNGGGMVNMLVTQLTANEKVTLKSFVSSGTSLTIRGNFQMVRLA